MIYLSKENEENYYRCVQSMKVLAATTGVEHWHLMPDACPAGSVGTISVGGVVTSKYIHPAMHSSDMNCSVMTTVTNIDYTPERAKEMLDLAQTVTHFGRGPGNFLDKGEQVYNLIKHDRYIRPFMDEAVNHFGTQGDGNHFLSIGYLKSNNKIALTTHHGSRGLGAKVYRMALDEAKSSTPCYHYTADNAPLKDSDYYDTIKNISSWVELSHLAIHMGVLGDDTRPTTFTQHNRVYEQDGNYVHLKGAISFALASMATIPLTMSDPMLVACGRGFAPHGAGREMSRADFNRTVVKEREGIDYRFYSGKVDYTEFPEAYKSACVIRRETQKLASIVNEIIPYGCIMAGR